MRRPSRKATRTLTYSRHQHHHHHRHTGLTVSILFTMACATGLAACGAGAPGAPSANDGLVINRPTPQHISLVDQQGQPVSLAGLRGRIVVLAPFLTLCQDECPLVTAAFIGLQRDLTAAGLADKVAFVEATVDPGRDTVARLAAYDKEFGADWHLWTGSPVNLAAFWKDFGIAYQVVPEAQPAHIDWYTAKPLTYDVDHTDGYLLIDSSGRERFLNASAPNLHGRLNRKLTSLLNPGGIRGLHHPQQTDWTVNQALAAISWLLGTHVPAVGS